MPYINLKKILGPYKSKIDGRERVVLVFNDGVKKTISYPKYIMECYLNRFLLENETVDHIDGNFLNNNILNLQILDRKFHSKLDVKRNEDIEVNCTFCKKSFKIKGDKINSRNRKDKGFSGYFCSRSCSGKYGKEIQNNKTTKKVHEKIKVKKIKLKNKA
jgi:hypothetical protein